MKVLRQGLADREIEINKLSDQLKLEIQKELDLSGDFKKAKCKYCESLISYSKVDVEHTKDYPRYFIKCPVCDSVVDLADVNFESTLIDNILASTNRQRDRDILNSIVVSIICKKGKDKNVIQAISNYFNLYVGKTALGYLTFFDKKPKYNKSKEQYDSKDDFYIGFIYDYCFLSTKSEDILKHKKSLYEPISRIENKPKRKSRKNNKIKLEETDTEVEKTETIEKVETEIEK